MNEVLIANWNSVVSDQDIVYFLGDFAFCAVPQARYIFQQLAGKKYLVRGNHDKSISLMSDIGFSAQFDKHYLTIDGMKFLLSHYPYNQFKGEVARKYHRAYPVWAGEDVLLHGHCFDYSTEILTTEGWKNFHSLSLGENIFTYNLHNKNIEKDTVLELIKLDNFNGNIFELDAKSTNFRVTEGHTFIVSNDWNAERLNKKLIEDIQDKVTIKLLNCGYVNSHGLDLTDDELRLLVVAAADGSKTAMQNTTRLWRFKLKKQRKIDYVTALLTRLNITYKTYYRKDGTVSINFHLPEKLSSYSIKPLDKSYLKCSTHQIDVIFEAYINSDGYRYKENLFQIYTAKECEADLLQALGCMNGYTVNKGKRVNKKHGAVSYWVNFTKRNKPVQSVQQFKERLLKTQSQSENFWCIKTNNTTVIVRRNGKVLISGNCHSTQEEKIKYINVDSIKIPQYDVGVDANNYTPVNLEEIKKEIINYGK